MFLDTALYKSFKAPYNFMKKLFPIHKGIQNTPIIGRLLKCFTFAPFQVILAVGIHQSIKVPDREHPYGYDNLRYVSSLISGVGIFCIGAGLSWYHGIQGILHPDSVESLHWVGAGGGGWCPQTGQVRCQVCGRTQEQRVAASTLRRSSFGFRLAIAQADTMPVSLTRPVPDRSY